MRSLACWTAASLAAATLFGAIGCASASAASSRVVDTSANVPLSAHVLGTVPSSTRLQATVALEPRNATALHAYATAVSTPGTAQYGRFLTVRAFAARFGATSHTLQTVETELEASGLHVSDVPANHLEIDLTGSAAQIETAFSTDLERVRLGSRTAYANIAPLSVPASIARYVQSIVGLDDLYPPQPAGLTAERHLVRRSAGVTPHTTVGNGPQPCTAATDETEDSGSPGYYSGYTANEISSMYDMNPFYVAGDEGAGQTVALMEYQPFQLSDINAYQSCYGLPETTPTTINVDGGPGAWTSSDTDDESGLDIEQIIGLAPKATIDVYQAPDSNFGYDNVLATIVSADAAKVISSSYGVCEALTPTSTMTQENTLLEEAAVQGQSFFISSGDSGSTMCYQATRTYSTPNKSLSVIDPGGQPFATAVGGTSLGEVVEESGQYYWDTPTDGDYPDEFVWNDGVVNTTTKVVSGTGGGVSSVWAMPSYQSGAAASLGVIQTDSSTTCGGAYCREVPDVSADGDPNSGYAVYVDGGETGGGWNIYGGTSASAPLWAAMTALWGASAACDGKTLGFENPALYGLAGTADYASYFHDITAADASPFTDEANNDVFGGKNADNPDSLYPLETGYDMATGLGTPVASTLGAALCKMRTAAVSITNPGAQKSIVGGSVSLAVKATDGDGGHLTYKATGLPAGLSITAGTGVISGTPTTAGTDSVAVSATDVDGVTASSRFTWTISRALPKVSSASFKGLTSSSAKLSLKVTAPVSSADVTKLVITLPSGVKTSGKLSKDLSVKSGSKKLKFTASGSGSKVTIVVKSPAASEAVTLSKLKVSKSLKSKIKKHKTKTLSLRLSLKTSGGASTTITEKLKT